MKKFALIFNLFICIVQLNAQDPKPDPNENKYHSQNINALKVVEVMDACGFQLPIFNLQVKLGQ